jgi:hypothetical protein
MGYFAGTINVKWVLLAKFLTPGEYRFFSSPKALSVSISFKSDPAWNEKRSGVGQREKVVSTRMEKNVNVAASVLLIFLSSNAQQHPSWRAHDLADCRAL